MKYVELIVSMVILVITLFFPQLIHVSREPSVNFVLGTLFSTVLFSKYELHELKAQLLEKAS